MICLFIAFETFWCNKNCTGHDLFAKGAEHPLVPERRYASNMDGQK
jgi:hypothetical protein